MKKALAALIALALPAAALAEGASGFYVQADAAHAKASSSLGSAKGFSPRISAGYRYIGKVNTVKNVRSGELSAGVRVKF